MRSKITTGWCKILEEFPEIRQTFNLVPSMMVQVEEYARGEANDPFLDAALKPAERSDRRKSRLSSCGISSWRIPRA